MKASTVVTIAMLLASLAMAARAMAEPGVTDTEVLIGSCAALDGPANFLGQQTVLGARAYLQTVNDQGGIHGRKLKLLSLDDSYEPAKAIECFNRLKQEHVFAAGFFVGTPTGAKHAPMAESSKIPIVGLFTGAQLLHEPFKRYVVNVRASYYDEAREQVDNLWNALGMRKIAVFYQDDAFGVAVLEGVKLALAPPPSPSAHFRATRSTSVVASSWCGRAPPTRWSWWDRTRRSPRW